MTARLLILTLALCAGCARHGVQFRISTESNRWEEFRELGRQIAAEFAMTDQTPVPPLEFEYDHDRWVVLGTFRRDPFSSQRVYGSGARMALFIDASTHRPIVDIGLVDYSHGFETEFATQIRQAIERRLAALVPRERVEVFSGGRLWSP